MSTTAESASGYAGTAIQKTTLVVRTVFLRVTR
jgi:hypothetical protein